MAQLVVRNLPAEVVRNLKKRAAEHNHSAEAEHRDILVKALVERKSKKSLLQVFLEMPDTGTDDLDSPRGPGRKVDLR